MLGGAPRLARLTLTKPERGRTCLPDVTGGPCRKARATRAGVMSGIFGKIDTHGWHRTNRMACCGCLVSLLLVDCGRKHAIDIQGPALPRRVRRPTKSCLSPPRRLRAETRNRHSGPRTPETGATADEVLSLSSSSIAGGNTQSTFAFEACGPATHLRSAGLLVFGDRRRGACRDPARHPDTPAYADRPDLSRPSRCVEASIFRRPPRGPSP